MKNPIIKKTLIPFKDLQSLSVPYAGNCQPDAERVNEVCVCDCVCHCDCDCRCMEDNECHCDCTTPVCDCNCVCDCGALDDTGTLIIPEGIERIYPDTYRGREEIKRVLLPKSLKAIGENAFRDCKQLVEIVFQEGLVEIEEFAFRGCHALTAIELPDSLTTLGTCAFDYCYSVERLVFGRSFSGLDLNVFGCCNVLAGVEVRAGNSHYKAIDGVLYSKCGRTLLWYPRGKCDECFEVPARVTKIEQEAFRGNDHLVAVHVSEGVHTIRERAFQGCNELCKVSLPRSLKQIEEHAFADCRSLKRVNYVGTDAEWSKVKKASSLFSYQYNAYVIPSADGNDPDSI